MVVLRAFALLAFVCARADAAEAPSLHGTTAAMGEKLQVLRGHRSAADDKPLEQAFAELMQRKYAAAWPNVPAISLVLERDGREALQKGDLGRAKRLFELARDVSPSSTSARLWLLWARLRHEPAAVGDNTRELMGLLRVWASDHRAAHFFVANTASALFIALLCVAFVTLCLVCLRQWRYVAHDVSLLMPKGSSHWFAYALFVLLLGLPVAFRFGFLSIAFVLFFLPFLHAERGERLGLSFAFLIVLLLPLSIEPLTQSWIKTQGRAADLYTATRTNTPDEALRRLEKEPESIETLLAAGLVYKRKGEVETALHRFEKATKLQPNRSDAWLNYGVTLFWLDKLPEAEAAFKKARELQPQSIAALFNGARMLHRAGEAERGTELLQEAQGLDQQRTGALVAISRMIGPRFMVEETLPNEDIWNARGYAVEEDMARAAGHGILPYLVGGRDPMQFAVVGFVWLLVAWGLSLAMRKVQLALPCPRCGRPICLRTDKDLPDRSLCGQCYHAFVKQDIDTAARIHKESECRRHERRRAQLVTFASIVLAGAGHVLRGRALLGSLLIAVAGTALVGAMISFSVVPLPFRTGQELFGPRLLLSVIVWIVAAVLALVTVPKKD